MTTNADMPAMEFRNDDGGSIEFSRQLDEILVTIEDFGAYVDCPTYFHLTKNDLAKLVPKLQALLKQLEGESK